jgi:protocatechuate 3,4-dioxygenase beta subunit
MQGSSTLLGMMTYPIPANSVILVQDTANYNFAFPSLPGQVTISGQVTDGNGRPLSGVVVSAASQSITGRPNLRFSAATQTDASGNYRLVVLSGANYQVSFSPPLPLQ